MGCGGGKSAPPSIGTFTDNRDGKTYKIVQIGRQVWFAENLNYDVPDDTSDVCYENIAENCERYGRLYNWEAAKQACPAGWHLSTAAEWKTLVNYAGGEWIAAMNLKSRTGWDSYEEKSGNGTDIYGFSALPGGYGYGNVYYADEYGYGSGDFYCAGIFGYWWSATEYGADYARCWGMNYRHEYMHWSDSRKTAPSSVRCVADKRKEAKK